MGGVEMMPTGFGRIPVRPTVSEIKDRFTSLSSTALRQIADEAERIIRERGEDGVFD